MEQALDRVFLSRSSLIGFLSLFIAFAGIESCFSKDSVPNEEEKESPWFTGPLLTPSARVVPKGHVNLEPYLFWNVTTGLYDNDWKVSSIPTFNQIDVQLQIKLGIAKRIELSLAPQSVLSFSQGKAGTSFGDLPVGIGYQLYEGKPEDWLTYVKLSVSEIFPTGKYQHLDPDLHLTDAAGRGSFITVIGLTFSKLFEFPENKFLNLRWDISSLFFAPTHIHGFSIFGGDTNTRGTIHHGNSYVFVAGAEYTITKEFTLACDFLARYVQKKSFKGFSATPIFEPESIQFSLAPAFEYNWNSSLGIIVGTWFTIAGRNSARFITGVAAFNYYY